MTPLLPLVWGLGGDARPLRLLAAHTRPIVLGRPAAHLGSATCLTCATQPCLILFRVAVITVAVSKSGRGEMEGGDNLRLLRAPFTVVLAIILLQQICMLES